MMAIAMLLVIAASLLLQSLLPPVAFLGHAKVPVVMSVVVYYALTYKRTPMLIAGLAAGIVYDAMSVVPLGWSSFWFCVSRKV